MAIDGRQSGSDPTGSLVVAGRADRPVYEAKWRRAGRQVKRRIGPAWLERAADDSEWLMRRGRVPEGYFDEKRAIVRMAELIAEHDREERAIEAGERERRERGVSFRELAAEWLEHLRHERGAKPSTLSDYRYMLAEPGTPHRRGGGKSPGVLMAAFGDRPAAKITTRDVSTFLRRLDTEDVSPRSVNKNRQVLSAIFGYACRGDTHGLPSNPVAGTTKRREPPAAVLDFYEPEEVETIASAAADGSHRGAQPSNLSTDEIAWRAREDAQDGELFRLAAYTGLRLGELIALRWEDVDFDTRRMVVHRAVSAGVEGPTKSWQARFLPLADPPPKPWSAYRPAATTPHARTTSSARASAGAWTPQPCDAASRLHATPPGCGPCASTRCATPPAASSPGTQTRVSCRSSSDTRGSRPPSATCMPRLGPRISNGSTWRLRPDLPASRRAPRPIADREDAHRHC